MERIQRRLESRPASSESSTSRSMSPSSPAPSSQEFTPARMISSPSNAAIRSKIQSRIEALQRQGVGRPDRSSSPNRDPFKRVESPSEMQIPKSSTITCEALASYMAKRGGSKLTILFIDLRPRDEFQKGHLNSENVVCIEPVALRRGVSADQIEESLVLSPRHEQELFARRNQFDLLVYYDWESRVNTYLGGPVLDEQQVLLRNISAALNEYGGWRKPLKHLPRMLVGGLLAWQKFAASTSITPLRKPISILPVSTPALQQPRKKPVPAASISSTHSTSPVSSELNLEEEVKWLSSLKDQDVELVSADNESPDLKRRNRQVVLTPTDQYARNVMEFFQRFPDPAAPQSMTKPQEELQSSSSVNFSRPALAVAKPLKMSIDIPPNIPPDSLQRRGAFVDHPFHGFTEVNDPNYLAPTPTKTISPAFPTPNAVAVKTPIDQPTTLSPPTRALESERSTSIGSQFSQLGPLSIGTTGLKNLGNTCFMNCILQCMSGTVPLARYHLDGSYRQHIIRNNPLGTQGQVPDVFAKLIRAMWDDAYTFISPVTFKDTVGKFRPEFKNGEQQDAQEFLAFLLDSLHEDLNRNATKPKLKDLSEEEEARRERMPIEVVSEIEWARYLHSNNSIIVSLFQGQFRSRLQCTVCEYTSTTYNAFMYLSLPIPAERATDRVTLQQCVDAFVAEEVLEGDDAWHCPRCRKPRRATKRLTISKLPPILIVHLKRFLFKGPWRDKLNSSVDLPLRDLDFTRYIPPAIVERQRKRDNAASVTFSYDLYAISNHYGGLNGGHYTANVRNGYKGVWNVFDDSRVSVIDDHNIVV